MAKLNPRMPIWRRRRLNADEIALGRSIFGDEIDWSRVRVMQAPPLGFGAMVPRGRTVVFSRWRMRGFQLHAAR